MSPTPLLDQIRIYSESLVEGLADSFTTRLDVQDDGSLVGGHQPPMDQRGSIADRVTVVEIINDRADEVPPAGEVDDVVREYPVEPRQPDGAAPVRRIRWSVGAVAAAAVLAVVSFGLLRDGDGDRRSADQPSESTKVGVEGLTPQIVVVQAWAAAYNGGRLDEYLSYFSPNGVEVGPTYELIWGSPTDPDAVAALMAAGDDMTSGARPLCDPIDVMELEDGGGDLSCWMTRHDRFHTPAVIGWSTDHPAPYWVSAIFFTFDEDDKITSVRLGSSDRENEAREAARPFLSYRTGFRDWLRAAHPDVAAQFGSGVVGALPRADDMATAIEYVAEFVDQTYPEAEVIAAWEADRDRLVATIEAMLEAYNRHDPEEWLSFFPDGINLDDASGLTIEHEQAFMAADGRWTLTAPPCPGTGFGFGSIGFVPFFAVVRGPEALGDLPRVISCKTMRADDFYGAGGITRQVPFDFIFDGEGRLTGYATGVRVPVWFRQNGDWFDPHAEFARDFLTWLEATHPDVAADFDSDGLITARDMPTALEYVDEFVAQSDTYP